MSKHRSFSYYLETILYYSHAFKALLIVQDILPLNAYNLIFYEVQ